MGIFSEAFDKLEKTDGTNSDSFVLQTPDVQIKEEVPQEDSFSEEKVTTQPVTVAIKDTGKWDERLFKSVNESATFPEVFKALRSRILHPRTDKKIPKTVMITSASPNEGKSFVAANLGISIAQGLDQYSLLVDCDLRRPTLAKMFGMDASHGLADYLRENVNLSSLIGKTSVKKLSLLPSGTVPVNPAELLSSERMKAMIDELSSRYEDRIIIFDTPPALVAAESIVIANHVDGVILVVRQGGAGREEIQKVIELIGQSQILGIVFNDRTINSFEKSIIKGYGNYYQGYQ